MAREVVKSAERKLRAGREGAKLKASTRVVGGLPMQAILDEAEAFKADFIFSSTTPHWESYSGNGAHFGQRLAFCDSVGNRDARSRRNALAICPTTTAEALFRVLLTTLPHSSRLVLGKLCGNHFDCLHQIRDRRFFITTVCSAVLSKTLISFVVCSERKQL